MLWEGVKEGYEVPFTWNTWSNERRIQVLRQVVFPAYHEHYVSLENERWNIRKDYGVEGTFLFCSDSRLSSTYLDQIDGEFFIKRSPGGKYDTGNSFFRASLSRSFSISKEMGLAHILCAVFHFCSGNKEKGCAAFDNDTDAAIKYIKGLKARLHEVTNHLRNVYVMVIGIDTFTGEVTFFGENGDVLRMSKVVDPAPESLLPRVHKMFHSWPMNVKKYIVNRMMMGNLKYMRENAGSEKPLVSREHHEFIWGPGYGYFPCPKHRVFIHNPFIADLREWDVGLKVMRSNLKGRIDNGFIVSASAMYRDEGEKSWAIDEAGYWQERAAAYIRKRFPDLAEIMSPMPMVVSRETREVTLL